MLTSLINDIKQTLWGPDKKYRYNEWRVLVTAHIAFTVFTLQIKFNELPDKLLQNMFVINESDHKALISS